MRRIAVVLMLLLALVACGKDDKKVNAAEDATTTTVEDTTTTVPTTLPEAATTTAKPVHVKQKKCTSATSDTTDGNQPMKIEICIDDVNPRPTQKITLTVTADDPDAPIGDGMCDIYVDWEGNAGSLCRDALIPPGPNDPQRVPQHGHIVKTYDHVYTDAGEQTVEVVVWSGPGDGHPDPYDNYAQASLKISVK